MGKMGGRKFVYCDEWSGDSSISLKDLERLLPLLKKKYGANASLCLDAGYNNVQVMIQPSKTLKGK